MTFILMLYLTFGTPQISFPWWLWVLVMLHNLVISAVLSESVLKDF